MRTTLEIEDDILQAAKELARIDSTTTGRIISKLARLGLRNGGRTKDTPVTIRNGVPILPLRNEVITTEHIRDLMDEEGI